jgi:hypothetical protein
MVMALKDVLAKAAKKWLLNADGEISFMKIGAEAATVAGIIVGLPQAMFTAGIEHIVIPAIIIEGAKLVLVIGSMIAVVGARNAMDKIKK